MNRERKHLDRDDLNFYLITLALFLGIIASIIMGIIISHEVFFMIGNILFIVLTIYLTAVAQIEWKRRGRKWW